MRRRGAAAARPRLRPRLRYVVFCGENALVHDLEGCSVRNSRQKCAGAAPLRRGPGCVRGFVTWCFAVKMPWCMTWKAVPFETVVKNALVHDLEGCVRGPVTWCFVVQNAMVHDLEGCSVRNSRQKTVV